LEDKSEEKAINIFPAISVIQGHDFAANFCATPICISSEPSRHANYGSLSSMRTASTAHIRVDQRCFIDPMYRRAPVGRTFGGAWITLVEPFLNRNRLLLADHGFRRADKPHPNTLNSV
jgi:hypothetical protein